MKRIITSILMVAMSIFAMAQKPITIENPEVLSQSIFNRGLTIEKIERTKNQTKIYFKYYHLSQENKIQISGESYLTANGKQFQQNGIEGAPMNQFFEPTGENNTSAFALTFPSIDNDIDMVDYIECSGPTCFRIFDIPLTQAASNRNKELKAKAKEEFEQALKKASEAKDNNQSLSENQLMIGSSTLKGKFIGYHSQMFGDQKLSVKCYVNNPIKGGQEIIEADINDKGEFVAKIPLTSKYQTIGIQTNPIAFLNESFVASINSQEEIIIDLDYALEAMLGRNPEFCVFKGDNAYLNTAFIKAKSEGILINQLDVLMFSGTTANDFKNHIYQIAQKVSENIDNSSMPKIAKEYAKITLRAQEGYYIGMTNYLMEYAYRAQNNIAEDQPSLGFTPPEITKDYLNYVEQLNLNSSEMLYSNDYQPALNNYYYIVQSMIGNNGNLQVEILKKMIDSGNTDKVVRNVYDILNASPHNLSAEELDNFNVFNQKYAKEFDKLYQECTKEKLQELLNKKGLFYELVNASSIIQIINNRNLLDENAFKKIELIGNKTICQYAKQANDELKAEIEAEKAKGGYYICQTNESTADAIMADILKNHKGKVVYIDLWATWCGPCRMGIAAMKAHHDSMKERGVDFVYVSDETSPTSDYNNAIIGMKGDHYRLTNQQMQTLKQKFKVTGIPFYIFVDKNGNVADTQSGFGGVERIVNKLNELINQ